MSMKKQRGFSLIELMIAITIGLVLMTGVVQMFLSSKRVFSTQQGISRVQETGRLGMEFIAKDIREAGYFGCLSRSFPSITNTLNSATSFLYDFGPDNAIKVYKTKPAGLTLAKTPKTGTQILVIRSANGAGASVAKDNTANSVFVTLTTDKTDTCPSGICKDDVVMVSDCAQARIFQVTNSPAVVAGDTQVRLDHGAGANPGNAKTSWGGAGSGPEQHFGAGADVMGIHTIVYFIADNADKRPSLYQKVGSDSAVELLSGVENMNMTFGVDTGSDSLVDSFVTRANVTDWTKVLAVRLELLVQSKATNASSESQTYTFAGTDHTVNDGRIRQVFTSTIGIRSRLP